MLRLDTIFPHFVLNAMYGNSIGLGLLQALLLIAGGTVLWYPTRGARLLPRLLSLVTGYWGLNLGFAMAVRWHLAGSFEVQHPLDWLAMVGVFLFLSTLFFGLARFTIKQLPETK